jgi:hypothetical protein
MRLFEPLVAHQILDKAFDDYAFDNGNSGQEFEPIPRPAPSGYTHAGLWQCQLKPLAQ